MVFEIGETESCKEIREIIDVLEDFRKNYNLNRKNITYIIEKQNSNIAPYFLIYPKSDEIKIKNVLPHKNGYTYMENLLIDNENESLILLNGRYFRILKQKQENLKN